MKIARFSHRDSPAYGIVDGDELVVLRSDPLFDSYDTTGERVPLDSVRLLAPVLPRSKVIGYGPNYSSAAPKPTTPTIFMKPNTAVIGPDDPVVCPAYSNDVVFEPEVAIVIGRMCRHVPAAKAADVIFGYTVAADFAARDFLGDSPQWLKAKGWDTAQPLGPWIETDLALSGGLAVRSYVDGELVVEGNTSEMWRGIGEIIADITALVTLLPGDVIMTGTPGEVSVREGQRAEVEVEGIGRFGNPIVRD